MAIVITNKKLVDGPKLAVVQFTGVFTDATGNETAAVKVDASTLTPAAGAANPLKVMRIWWSCTAVQTFLEFDGTTDGHFLNLSQDASGYLDFRAVGGFRDNASTPTGDITLTTIGTVAEGQGYSVIIEVSKS